MNVCIYVDVEDFHSNKGFKFGIHNLPKFATSVRYTIYEYLVSYTDSALLEIILNIKIME